MFHSLKNLPMLRTFGILVVGAFSFISAAAQIPAGYYTEADGLTGSDLKTALFDRIHDHTVLSYNDLWDAYETTDVVPGTTDQVYDMFSPALCYYSSRGSKINREHCVPQSWWGKGSKIDCYSDLWNVYPSEVAANSAKSNYPLGRITGTVKYENERMRVGSSDNDGGAPFVFEPCDEFKGDFARAYFYVATCYQNATWMSGAYAFQTGVNAYPTLKDWIIDLLLEWNALDPVSEKEIARQEAVYAIQKNRNPYVDYPQLADYIWGAKNGVAFDLTTAVPNVGEGGSGGGDVVYHAAAPKCSPLGGASEAEAVLVGLGTHLSVRSATVDAVLYYRVNGGEWDSIASASPTVGPELTYSIVDNLCIEAWTRRNGYLSSDTVVAYYAVAELGDYLLYEDFASITDGRNTDGSGSAGAWNGNENFPQGSKTYAAGHAVRLGSSSGIGTMTSRALAYAGNMLTIEIDVKGWTNVEGDLVVTVSGCTSQRISYAAKMADEFETQKLTFTGISSNPTITIATSTKRAFIGGVRVVGMTTGIEEIETPKGHSAGQGAELSVKIHDLLGRSYDAMPSKSGIYVVDGKKIMIR